MAHAGGGDDVVDPGVVVAPGRQHGGTRIEQPQPGLLAAGPEQAVVAGRRGRGDGGVPAAGAAGADDVHSLDRALEDAVEELGHTFDERLGAGVGGSLLGVEAAPDQHRHQVVDQRGVVRCLVDPERAQQGQGRSVRDAARAAGLGLVVAAGGLERGEHRPPRLVQGHELADPLGEVLEAGGVGRDPFQPLGQRHHLLAEPAGQGPEHVVLAGEVLVEGGARAAGALGDQLDPGLGEAGLAEHLERGAEDAALRVGAALAHERVAPERWPPHHARIHRRNATI